ncbi:unannotated protein [freshwater metagenome]|uniref:Unannotated protein n=1 Tax=freshwater metagenome TaxID=449393 RepID=A0A6J7P1N0_9ZZZZ
MIVCVSTLPSTSKVVVVTAPAASVDSTTRPCRSTVVVAETCEFGLTGAAGPCSTVTEDTSGSPPTAGSVVTRSSRLSAVSKALVDLVEPSSKYSLQMVCDAPSPPVTCARTRPVMSRQVVNVSPLGRVICRTCPDSRTVAPPQTSGRAASTSSAQYDVDNTFPPGVVVVSWRPHEPPPADDASCAIAVVRPPGSTTLVATPLAGFAYAYRVSEPAAGPSGMSSLLVATLVSPNPGRTSSAGRGASGCPTGAASTWNQPAVPARRTCTDTAFGPVGRPLTTHGFDSVHRLPPTTSSTSVPPDADTWNCQPVACPAASWAALAGFHTPEAWAENAVERPDQLAESAPRE